MDAAFEEAVLTLRACINDESTTMDSPTAASSANAPARCRPWSQADFFRRLRTFTPQTWFGKSLAASPPRCAANGWENDGMDRLRCEGCHATLTIESGLDNDAVPDVASSAHHAAMCPWAGQACPPEVTQFPLATPEALLARTGKRFKACRQLLAQHQGRITVPTPNDLAALLGPIHLPLAAVARRLQQEAARAEGREGEEEGPAAPAGEADATDVGAAVLALHGWEASEGASSGWVLACGLCGRRVEAARLLARRSAMSLSPRKGGGAGGSPGRRTTRNSGGSQGQGQEEKVEFDPVEQHRYYCPWAGSGLESGGEEGWRQAAKAVASRTPRAWFEAGEGEAAAAVMPQWLAVGCGSPGAVGGGGEGGRPAPPPEGPEEMWKTAMDLLRSF